MSARARPGAWRRRFVLGAASLGIGALLILACEGVFRLIGLGAEPPGSSSRLKYQRVVLPVLAPAKRPDGTAVLRPADPRIHFQSAAAAKPPNGLRVVAFGGSATAGLGFSPNVTFPRHLEELLARSLPDRPVEVLNLGVVAFSSGQVAAMAEDVCSGGDPDVLVVYSGNNEFLELHAEKFSALDATWKTRARDRLSDTYLYRALLSLARRGAGPASVGRVDEEELRISEDLLIQDIEVTDAEVERVLDDYAANLERIAACAARHDVPVLFLTVATNWEWRGRTDLPEGWLDELLGAPGPRNEERLRAGVALLDARLAGLAGFARHDDLFRRAELHAALGESAAARADYRAAMNHDPHLRRALDAGNARVQAVAERAGGQALDIVEWLAARSDDGIVGFDEFYDYVHFTPRGAALTAQAIHARLIESGLVEPSVAADGEAYVAEYLARLADRETDFPEARDWLGFCFDRGMLADRDLWKYDRALEDLDARLAADPADVEALVYRGNASYFRSDGAPRAAADYRAALELQPDHDAARGNLEALLAERTPRSRE